MDTGAGWPAAPLPSQAHTSSLSQARLGHAASPLLAFSPSPSVTSDMATEGLAPTMSPAAKGLTGPQSPARRSLSTARTCWMFGHFPRSTRSKTKA